MKREIWTFSILQFAVHFLAGLLASITQHMRDDFNNGVSFLSICMSSVCFVANKDHAIMCGNPRVFVISVQSKTLHHFKDRKLCISYIATL